MADEMEWNYPPIDPELEATIQEIVCARTTSMTTPALSGASTCASFRG
jgi:hypothetical protein